MSNLDVVTAESQVAASQRDLILAQTNLEQQETTLKQLISKKDDRSAGSRRPSWSPTRCRSRANRTCRT